MLPQSDLGTIAREAAAAAGAGAPANIRVEPFVDSEGAPAYRFSFLVDRERLPRMSRARLLLGLNDRLEARGDAMRAYVRVLDTRDWMQVYGA